MGNLDNANMKRMLLSVLGGLVILLSTGSAPAITIGLDPADQVVGVGAPVNVALTISGLGDLTAPSLSTFDLDVNFDPVVLAFGNVTYGDPFLGDQLDLSGFGSLTATTLGIGSVNLFELSFDIPGDLEALQPGAFILATLSFETLAPGTSPVTITLNALGDALGDPLVADITNASVTAVPEPSTMLLLGAALAGLAGFGRKRLSRKP